jgi:hypothetical protein
MQTPMSSLELKLGWAGSTTRDLTTRGKLCLRAKVVLFRIPSRLGLRRSTTPACCHSLFSYQEGQIISIAHVKFETAIRILNWELACGYGSNCMNSCWNRACVTISLMIGALQGSFFCHELLIILAGPCFIFFLLVSFWPCVSLISRLVLGIMLLHSVIGIC